MALQSEREKCASHVKYFVEANSGKFATLKTCEDLALYGSCINIFLRIEHAKNWLILLFTTKL